MLLFLVLIDVGHIRGFVQIGTTFICVTTKANSCDFSKLKHTDSSGTSRTSVQRYCRLQAEVRSTSTQNDDVALEHRGVPSEHQGLHSALYGDGDDHGVSEKTSAEFVSNNVLFPADTFLDFSKGKKTGGVFAVLDVSGTTTFVGFSRNLYTSISGANIIYI